MINKEQKLENKASSFISFHVASFCFSLQIKLRKCNLTCAKGNAKEKKYESCNGLLQNGL